MAAPEASKAETSSDLFSSFIVIFCGMIVNGSPDPATARQGQGSLQKSSGLLPGVQAAVELDGPIDQKRVKLVENVKAEGGFVDDLQSVGSLLLEEVVHIGNRQVPRLGDGIRHDHVATQDQERLHRHACGSSAIGPDIGLTRRVKVIQVDRDGSL